MKQRGTRRSHSYHVSNQDENVIHFQNPQWDADYRIVITSENNSIFVTLFYKDDAVKEFPFDASVAPKDWRH